METDLISVLIPAYNVAKYLDRCLRSVVRQTYRNLEIVVVDDGSTDHTDLIAKKYAAQDQRVVVYQKPNEGSIAKTRNFLLDHCHGKYCVWVDSDDRVKPRYVEKLHRALTVNGADMSICKFALRVFPLPVMPPLWHRTRVYAADTMLPRMVFKLRIGFSVWNKMYRTDWLRGEDAVRFDPALSFGEDLLFNVDYLRRCQKIAWINDKLYSYSWRPGSEMHQEFSQKHINFVDKLLALCANEANPVVRDTLRGWAAFSCCGFAFLADKKRYPAVVQRMKHFAHEYRADLYKNQLAKTWLKLILWLGLKTWCRTKPLTHKQKNYEKL